MKIIPAIDLLDGKCVRLLKGNYQDVSEYNSSPLNQINIFLDAGFDYVHIVDLDAARSGKNKNLPIIEQFLLIEGLNIQVGGGIRDEQTLNELISIGVDRLIVGTAAINNQAFREEIRSNTNLDKIIFGLDFNVINDEPMLSVNGWTKNTNINLFDFINNNQWIKNILATDISVDGTLEGPNCNIYKKILENKNTNLIASGGIGNMEDIKKLKNIGTQECVVGKAIYENKLSLKDLINVN